MAINPTVTNLDVTSHPADIQKLASLDVVNWLEILSHKTVLGQGVIEANAQRDTLLFSTDIAPRALASQTHKSIIKHLSELFAQWHGTLVFELVVSIPYFVATKIAFAYVPEHAEAENWPASSLVGLQNSAVINPSDSSSTELRVPFVSPSNWLPTNAGTGQIVAKLLDPIVSSLDLTGGLPWTLFVAADPGDFAFRYVAPPPLQTFEDPKPPIGQSGPTLADMTLARSMSTAPFKLEPGLRTRQSWSLVQQVPASKSIQYKSALLIPRTRIEYVVQKIRGQFPTGTLPKTCIAAMFDPPMSSYNSYKLALPPSPMNLYPYLSQPFLFVTSETLVEPRTTEAPVQVLFSGREVQIFLQVPEEAFRVLTEIKPQMWFALRNPNKNKWYTTSRLQYARHQQTQGAFWHLYHMVIDQTDATAGIQYDPNMKMSDACMASWILEEDMESNIIDAMMEIETCPSTVTHLALYSTMPPNLATTFVNWLITADNSPPPAQCLIYSISFSLNQSALAFNDGRFSESPTQKGLVWKLFKLFRGDETKWWAWLVKGLDVVVDALIAAFVGRAGATYVVPIDPASGLRVEAVGNYDEALISKTEPTYLEQIREVPLRSLLEFLGDNEELTIPRFRKQSRHQIPELTLPSSASRPPSSQPPSSTSRHSSRHRGKRGRRLFRKSK